METIKNLTKETKEKKETKETKKPTETTPSLNREIIVSVKGGMVIDVVAPPDTIVRIRDYDTPITLDRNYIEDEKVEIYKHMIETDMEGEEYVEEIW